MMTTAEQTVSAVLEATNLRYPVEVGQSEGFHFVKYSDGYKEIRAFLKDVTIPSSGVVDITFPIAFSDTNYCFCPAPTNGSTANSITNVREVDGSRLNTGLSIKCVYSDGSNHPSAGVNSLNFVVYGY